MLGILADFGVRPDMAAGHSFGEVVALHAAGAISEADVLRIARERGLRMAEAAKTTSGAMSAVIANAETVKRVLSEGGLADSVVIANHNAPDQVVISGESAAITRAEELLRASKLTCKRLDVATAFHSPVVSAAAKPFGAWLSKIDVSAPKFSVYANATAEPYGRSAKAVRTTLGAQLAAPVRFVEMIEAMYASGVRTFVEVGPGSVLTGLVSKILDGRPHRAIATDRKGETSLTSFHHALGKLAVAGLPLALGTLWQAFAPAEDPRSRKTPKLALKLNGSNYAKPYPPKGGAAARPLPNPEIVPEPVSPTSSAPMTQHNDRSTPIHHTPAAPIAPAQATLPESAQLAWIAAYQEAQRQTAEAHAAFQRSMADAHAAFLRSAETSFVGLATMLGGAPLAAAPSPVAVSYAPPMTIAAPAMIPPSPAPVAAPAPMPPAVAPAPVIAAPVAPAPSAPAPQAAPALDLMAIMLDVVSSKTGYPSEMIQMEMELEADLGIDSIKRVEILAAVREKAPSLPDLDPAALGALRTVGEIVAHLNAALGGHSAAPSPSAAPPHVAKKAVDAPRRWVTRAVPAPALGMVAPGLLGAKRCVITDDETGVASSLVQALATHGLHAEVVREVPADADAVIVLAGLRAIESTDAAMNVNREAFRAAKAIAPRFASQGGTFITVQDTGGDFGMRGADRAWLGGLSALAKTASQEWPNASVRAIDIERGASAPDALAAKLAHELVRGGPELEVGLREDGTRLTLLSESVPVTASTPVLAKGDVVLASGGARGVTAATLIALANETKCRLVLLGRTKLEDEPAAARGAEGDAALKRALLEDAKKTGRTIAPAELGKVVERILAGREVRATLDAIKAAGGEGRYDAVDVQDATALERLLNDVRASWGPIAAIVHGAGVLADRFIADKTTEQFDRVFDTKVKGLEALLHATTKDPLKAIVMFSSVAARCGNQGQCDYAMANEVLNKVANLERKKRGIRVRSLGWGPWEGGMVTPALKARFEKLGVPLISLVDGAQMLVNELGVGSGDEVELVLGGEPRAEALVSEPGKSQGERAFEVVIDRVSHPFVESHVVKGTPVLPAMIALELLARAAGARSPGLVVSAVRELKVLRGVRLANYEGHGDRFLVSTRTIANGSHATYECALIGEGGVKHYVAKVEMEPGLSHPTSESPAIGQLKPWSDIVYGDVLFHGPMFHAIKGLEGESERGIAGTLIGRHELGWSDEGLWITDPALLDGGLQLAVLWTKHALGGASLPTSIGAYVPHAKAASKGPFRAIAQGRTKNRDQAVFDIVFADPKGAPVARLEAVEISVLPGSRQELEASARDRADA